MSTGGVWSKHRFKIITAYQHPYSHPVSDFFFSNPALPGVSNLETTLNWILAVLYPQTKAAVATVVDLPAAANTINDFRVVTDDGDGNSAAYRWEQREGEAAAAWHKIYDMDWGSDSILEQFLTKTQALYLKVGGNEDLDINGTAQTGLYAGQTIYGGTLANSNLTLRANSGDGVGASTGYVQSDDNFRPAVHNTFTNGLSTFAWSNTFSTIFTAGTLILAAGSITDTSGTISFSNEHLTTTGNISGGIITGSTSLVASSGGNTSTLTVGSLVSSTGAISFDNENLTTTGTLSTGVHTVTNGVDTFIFDPNAAGKSKITSSLGEIDFSNENLVTTGTLGAGAITGTSLTVDNLNLDLDTITKTGAGNLVIVSSNLIELSQGALTKGITATGAISATTTVSSGGIQLGSAGTIIGTLVDTDVTITPNGTGLLVTGKSFLPSSDNALDLGAIASRFRTLFLGTSIGDGTTTISSATIQSLRNINSGVGDGMALFWDAATSTWLASAPDTEITHSTLSGLTSTDSGHTQFVMLAGRAGGQTVQGGTLASQTLVLESTSHATKGFIYFNDSLLPGTDASYSAGWLGKDFGDPSFNVRHIYSKGEHFGLRLENLGADATPSAQNVGRVFYNTADKLIKVDTGTAIENVGQKTTILALAFDGILLSIATNVSTDVDDARNCIWQLRDLAANNYEVIYATITTTQTIVSVVTNIALPVGSYKLVGIEGVL